MASGVLWTVRHVQLRCCVVGFRGAFVGLPRLYKVLKGVLGISIDIEIFGNTLHLQSLYNSAIM